MTPAHSFGPVARNHYLFHYVISGTGTHTAQNSSGDSITYKIRSGQGFMIFPHQICTYIADNELPWEYVWLEFDGLKVKEAVESCGLNISHPVYRPRHKDLAQQMKEEMLYITSHSHGVPVSSHRPPVPVLRLPDPLQCLSDPDKGRAYA